MYFDHHIYLYSQRVVLIHCIRVNFGGSFIWCLYHGRLLEDIIIGGGVVTCAFLYLMRVHMPSVEHQASQEEQAMEFD